MSTVRPSDINTQVHFWDAFDHSETEISANWVVRFCQDRGDRWEPFTLDEISSWAQENGHKGRFTLNRLPGRHLQQMCDGRYVIADSFIRACFNSAGIIERPG